MIIYTGLEKFYNELKPLVDGITFQKINAAEDIRDPTLLSRAEVVLVEGNTNGFVKQIQKIYATDKHISIIVLSTPTDLRQVKQTIQFAPFIGKNVLVVALTPDFNLKQVLENAAIRTRQKRSFQRLHIGREPINQPVKKVKLAEMGSFLEYAPIGALLVSEADVVINYNQQAKKMFPNLQMVYVDFTGLFTNKQAADIKSFIHSQHEPDAIIEIRNSNQYLELTSTEVYNEEGERHFLLLFTDVTNERLETRRIELILEALPQMAWTTDAAGDITYFNSGWYFYTGLTKQESLQSGWVNVVAEEDREKLLYQWQDAISSGKSYQHAARYLNTQGEYRWHLVRGAAVRDAANRITMWVGTCTDIH
ncbi:MAG TPA: PAS domain-containing protein, partial [Chitinophagaceae bacterium]